MLQNIHKYNIPKYIIHIHIIYICITYRNIHKYRSLQLSLYHTSSSSFSVRKTWCFQLQDKKLKYLFSMMYIAIPVRFNLTATWSWFFLYARERPESFCWLSHDNKLLPWSFFVKSQKIWKELLSLKKRTL